MLSDSDLDGLPDDREVVLSTNPNDKDTDGDGIPDGEEIHKWETDPTLHDYRPPEVTITSAKFDNEGTHAEYKILYSLRDPSGVEQVQFIKEDKVRAEFTPYNDPEINSGRVFFETGFVENSFDSVTGSTVDIEARDVHDNTVRQTALERQNFYGNLAGELNHANIFTNVAAQRLARISGLAASYGAPVRGVKQVAEGIPAFYETLTEDPLSVLDGITKIVAVMEKYGILETLVKAFSGSLQEKQETNNPYSEEENPELYTTYKVGWYEGYVVGKVTQMVLGAGAAKAVKQSKKVKKLDKFFSRNKGYRLAKGIKKRKDAAEAVVAKRLLDGASRVGVGTVRGAKSVGAKVRVWRAAKRLKFDSDRLAPGEQAALGRFLSKTGPDSARFINELDGESRIRFLSYGRTRCLNPVSRVGVYGTNDPVGYYDVSLAIFPGCGGSGDRNVDWDGWRSNLQKAVDDEDVSQEEVQDHIDDIAFLVRSEEQGVIKGTADQVDGIGDNAGDVRGYIFETRRGRVFAERALDSDSSVNSVEFEPIDEIDLLVKRDGSSDIAVEAKRADTGVGESSIENYADSAQESAEKGREQGVIGDSDTVRLSVDLTDRLGGKTVEEVFDEFELRLDTDYWIPKKNVKFDEIRIKIGDKTYLGKINNRDETIEWTNE